MTARATRELLELHVGHRTVIRDGRTLRCVDCAHTLLLDLGKSTLTTEDQGEHVTAAPIVTSGQDAYGRRPCPRCDKLVNHLRDEVGMWEPLPHAIKGDIAGRPCVAADQAGPAHLPPGGWRALVAATPTLDGASS